MGPWSSSFFAYSADEVRGFTTWGADDAAFAEAVQGLAPPVTLDLADRVLEDGLCGVDGDASTVLPRPA
jgi:hypothetical protein